MIKIIDGLRYNTNTASEICSYDNGLTGGDFKRENATLYKTKAGRYFLAGSGGARSQWAQVTSDGSTGGSGIKVVTLDEAKRFCEQFGSVEAIEANFAVEDA